MKSNHHFGTLPLLALLAAGFVAFAPGCSSKDKKDPADGHGGEGGTHEPQPTPCESNDDCPASDRCDTELAVCVPRCTADNLCPKNTGTYCDLESGVCVAGEPCEGDFTCGSDSRFSYCENTLDCVCSPDSSIAGGETSATGVCWRVAKTCAPCTESFECGNGPTFGNNKADCKLFTVGATEAGVCLPRAAGKCPPGMVQMDDQHPGLEQYCMPQGGDCGNMVVCEGDNDCLDPKLPICDQIRQICIPGCSFDFVSGESVGCAPGRVCHATTAGTNPDLLNDCATAPAFGVGSCDVGCTDSSECSKYGADFVCMADGNGSAKRCRPAGCIDDSECNDGQGNYEGYCDVRQNKCVYDACRSGPDPRRGCGSDKAYPDCAFNYKCVEGGEIGIGTCVEKNCIDNNGADVGCMLGEFCAGEPYRDMMTGQEAQKVVEGPIGTPVGECFGMDLAVWCDTTCSQGDHASCEAKSPYKGKVTGSPSICFDYGLGSNSCFYGCEYDAQCPAGWSCGSAGLEARCEGDGGGYQFCNTDSECGAGNRCVDPVVNGEKARFPDGLEPFKVCECSGTDSCGTGYSCSAGIATANKNFTDPSYEKVQARYCTNSTKCEAGGSCEWFREAGKTEDGQILPIFKCATPSTSMKDVASKCPTGTRPGRLPGDQYLCVFTQVCQPGYFTSESGPECKVAERSPQ